MSGSGGWEALSVLEALAVPRGRVVYVQASVDWIQRAGILAPQMLAALLEWPGAAGTLVMPSYPFHSTHHDYLSRGPIFDVRRSPAAIGLMPEMFRRTPGVLRSLDPDFCVCARGAEAEAIVGNEPAARDPFGPDSAYERMLQRGATLVGLGVSLNTNSFIHVIDSRAGARYPGPVYEDREYLTTVIDTQGRSRRVSRKCLRAPFQQLTSPSAIGSAMQPSPAAFTTLEIAGAQFFRWSLEEWATWSLSHARTQAERGRWPCWLGRLAHGVEMPSPS